jgi:hypothetical protein
MDSQIERWTRQGMAGHRACIPSLGVPISLCLHGVNNSEAHQISCYREMVVVVVLRFKLRVYTLSHSTSPFL